jgi:hypothetical protein
MNDIRQSTMIASTFRAALFALVLAVPTPVARAQAQTAAPSPGDRLRESYPELGALLDRFDVAENVMFRRLAENGRSPSSQAARDELRQRLAVPAVGPMAHAMPGGMNMNAGTPGPFGGIEARTASELADILTGDSAPPSDPRDPAVEPLTARASEVLRRGAAFRAHLFDIYADGAIENRDAAVDDAVAEYLEDVERSVPAEPKSRALLEGSPYASAFQIGYPQINGVAWSMQWLRLASLEPLMLGGDSDGIAAGVDTTIRRFRSKLTVMPGMTMAPTEFPAVPTVSPLLYNRHPEAAIILDNLNMFRAVIADVLVYPDVQDRSRALDDAVDAFTDRRAGLTTTIDYLQSALRGGIYNQGGPALGEEMSAPERNRSRMEMEHQMATPPTAMPGGN